MLAVAVAREDATRAPVPQEIQTSALRRRTDREPAMLAARDRELVAKAPLLFRVGVGGIGFPPPFN